MAILFRYLGLALQFILTATVARKLGIEEAGTYLAILGAVVSTYFLCGMGIPDGMVAHLLKADPSRRRALVLKCARHTTLVTLLLAALTYILTIGSLLPAHLWLYAVIWWLSYCAIFFVAQALVGVREAAWGSFAFYPAMNIALALTAMPYLLFAESPQLKGLLLLTATGASLAAVSLLIRVALVVRKLPRDYGAPDIAHVLRDGWAIALSRVAQTSLYWIPTWVISFKISVDQGAISGVAGRLAVAVAALLAALRFSIRPKLADAILDGLPGKISEQIRRASTLATAMGVVGLVANLAIGGPVIQAIFGPEYAAAAPILSVLLIGVIGESLGGPVDEYLKLAGEAGLLARVVTVTACIQALLCVWASRFGVFAVVACQSAAFVAMYGFLQYYVFKKRGIVCLPKFSN